METTTTICGECAQRLETSDVDRVPEMLDGYCPQCGSQRGWVVDYERGFLEFPPEQEEAAREAA